MSGSSKNPVTSPVKSGSKLSTTNSADVSNFLAAAKKIAPKGSEKGRMIFALDATMSRQPTWDVACQLQSEMFGAAGSASGLAIQLVYFRGFGECRASKWVVNTMALGNLMTGIQCRGGRTQIGKVLSHAVKEARSAPKDKKVSALIFVGDALEEELDELAHRAGEMGLLGIPAFMFQEGSDPIAETGFREIARLSRGAYMKFNAGSASQLAELLKSVARFASGGQKALETGKSSADRMLLEQLR